CLNSKFWTDVFLWSSVIFQIFGAILYVTEGGPCCAPTLQKRFNKILSCLNSKFWTDVFLWSSVIFQIFGAILDQRGVSMQALPYRRDFFLQRNKFGAQKM
ncbi:hypothetical protein ACJX0J_015249, partial [Zea mays]